MPPRLVQQDDAVISTAADIKQKVEQLQIRLQHCVQSLELVSDSTESQGSSQPQRHQHQARAQIAGDIRYPDKGVGKASQKSPAGTEHSTAGRDSSDVSLQNGHDKSHDGGSPMRPSMNGLLPGNSVGVTASDEADWEETVMGDDTSVEFGTGEFEQLRVHSASSGRQRYNVDRDAPTPAPPQSAVSVGAALQALKQNLSPHVQSSLQGAHAPTHGEQLRVQYRKAVGDSVQRRLVGRADAFHSSGSLDLSGVDLDAAAGYLRSGSLPNPQLALQGSGTAPNKPTSTSTSPAGMARPSLLGVGNDSQHPTSKLARQASAAGARIKAEEGLTSPASSRRESMDPQRSSKSKIPGPASSIGGGMQAAAHVLEGGSGPEAIHRRGPALVISTDAEPPRLSASASRDFGNGGSDMLLQQSLPSPVSAVGSARGWRFVAEESGGTVLVSIGSGAVDEDEETITPRTQGPRPPSGLLPRPWGESVTSLPPGAGDALAVVGFVPPPEAVAAVQSSGSEAPVRGFIPPASTLPQTPSPVVGFVPPHHVTGHGALPAPGIGFVPPWEASSPRRGPMAGFVPPSGLQTVAGVGEEGRGPTAAEPTVGFVLPPTPNAAGTSGASPRPSASAPHNGRRAGAFLLPSASMVPLGDFSFGIQAHVFSNTTKLSLRSSVSSNSGVGVRPDLPQTVPSDSAANSASWPQQPSWVANSGHSVAGTGRVGDHEQRRSCEPGSEGLSLQSSAVSRPPTTDGEEEGRDLEPGGKLPWEESSDDAEGDSEAAGGGPSAQGGLNAGRLDPASTAQPEPAASASGAIAMAVAAAQGPAQGTASGAAGKGRLPPPSLAVSSSRGSEDGGQPHAAGEAGCDRVELLTAPALDASRNAPSFSDHSRVASPAVRSTADPAAQPANSTATVMSQPSLPQPATLDLARAPNSGPAASRSPHRSPPHSPLGGLQSAPLPQRTSNPGVSITISDADIARAGGMVPALLELVRERFRQKGVYNLAQLAAAGLGHFADGGTALASPALRGETLTERIAARVDVFQSRRRSSSGLVAALSSSTDQDDGNGRQGLEDGFATNAHATARPLSRLSSTERASGATAPGSSSVPPQHLQPQPLSPVAPSAMAIAGTVTTPRAVASTGSCRGSNSSIPLPAPPGASAVATATTLPPSSSGPSNTASSRIPSPGQGQGQTGAPAAAYDHRALTRVSSSSTSPTVAQGVAFAPDSVDNISSMHRLSAASRASASRTPSPSRSPEAAAPTPVSARAEQGTQTPPLLQPQPRVEGESSSLQLGTARAFFLSTTVPLASARADAGSRCISNAAAVAEDKLLPPEMPTICTAADFFRGVASRATINTSAMAVPLRDLPAGSAVVSPFLAAADRSVPSPHGCVRTARDLLSFNGASVRPRRQSASGRGVVSTGGLVGRPASTGRRVGNGGGGRVVIDDEPIDLVTYPSSRTVSYHNRRASVGASTRVAFDDDYDFAPPAGPAAAGAAASSGRALTREMLMHLAHMPSGPRHAFETTTDEERGGQERQAVRQARQRRASGVSEGQGLATRPKRVSYGGTGPISSRQSQSPRTAAPGLPESLQPWSSDPSTGAGGDAGRQSHHQHHAHFEPAAVGNCPGHVGRSALPRQLALVMTGGEDRDGVASTDSPATAAAPGDAIPLPPLSLDAPDMPDPCGGDPAACTRSRSGAELPHDRFFMPQSPTLDRQGPGAGGATEPASWASVPGRRNRHPATADERGGPARLSRFSHAAQGGEGVATADATAPSSRRRRSLGAATNTDSWATGSSSEDDSSTDGRGAAAPGRPSRRGAAAAIGAGAGGSRSRRDDPKETRPRSVVPSASAPSASRCRRASGDVPAAAAAVHWSSRRRGSSWSDAEEGGRDDVEARELVSVPSDRTEDTETTLDLLERIPSTLSASRCALSPSSAAVSVLSQRRYVATARAHRSVSEANSTKRLSGGAPLLTEEEEEGDEDSEEDVPLRAGGVEGAPGAVARLSRRGSSGEVQASAVELAQRSRGERSAAEGEGPVGAGGLARARHKAGDPGGLSGRGRSRSRSRAGEGEDVQGLAAARRELEQDDDQGAASAGGSAPHGARTRQSPQRLMYLDTRVSPVPAVHAPSRARTVDGEACDSASLAGPGACATGQRTTQDRQPQKQEPPASYDTAMRGGEGVRGDRPSRSPSVTATAGGTTEADAAEREALIRRDRDHPDTAPGVDTDASARSRLRGDLQKLPPPAVLVSRHQQQRRSRRVVGGTKGDCDDSPCSSDTPPEDPQALLSPNYTQDMAVEEYGRDAATGDVDVDNVATPRGRRAPPVVSTLTPRRVHTTLPPPSLPYDPSEVPSAGVDDTSVSYTRDLERQELQDMTSELAALLPSPGRAPIDIAEDEPSFSMDPGSGRSPGASAAAVMAAAVAVLDRSAASAGLASWLAEAAASTRHRSAGAAAVAAATMSAAAGGLSPGRKPIGVVESLLLTLGSPGDVEASTDIRWRVGGEQTVTGTVPQPLRAASAGGAAPLGSAGGAADSDGIAMATSATSPPRVFASPSPSSPSVSGAAAHASAMPSIAFAAVPEWLAAAAVARRQSPPGPAQSSTVAPPPTRSPPRADVGTTAATPNKNAALAQLLASLRPIRPISATATAAAAVGSASDPAGAAASPRDSATGRGPAATLLAALTRAQTRPQSALHQQPQAQSQSQQRRRQQEGAGDEGAAGASRDNRLGGSSDPDPELRRLLLSAWGRWYLRRRVGGRNRARGQAAAGRLGDSDEGAAMAAAQARLQTLSAAQRAQAGLHAWHTIGSTPEMQEAAKFSRLYIAFTRWLGQARSSRSRSPKAAADAAAAAVRRWAEPRTQTTRNALPLAGATNIMPPYPTSSPGHGPAPANTNPPASPALHARAAATTAPQPSALQLHAAAAAISATPAHGNRPTSPSSTTAGRARIAPAAAQGPFGHVPSPRNTVAAPPVATTWPASLRTVLSPPPAAQASYAVPYASPAPDNPAVAPGAATAAVIAAANPGGVLASYGAGANSTPTISRTSGVRQVTSQPSQRQAHAPQSEPHVSGGVAWLSALSQRDHRPHSAAPQRPLSQPRQPATQPSSAAGVPTSLLAATAAAPSALAAPAPASELGRAATAAGTSDLESLIALQLLEGLGSGSDGVILAGLRLATGGAFVPPPSPTAAGVQHGGTAHPRPSSAGRLGVQRQLGLGSTGNGGGFSSGAGAGVGGGGGSILSRQLAVQQYSPQYFGTALGTGMGSSGGLLARTPVSPRPGGASALGGLAAGGGGGSGVQGGVSYAGLSCPTSPARVGSGHSLRPQSPIKTGRVNDNIRAAPPGLGHLNLSYYGIRP